MQKPKTALHPEPNPNRGFYNILHVREFLSLGVL